MLNSFQMRIISRRVLREFWETHADAEQPLKSWFSDARKADWKSPADSKAHYASASILPGDRVVWNIKGNDYRLVAKVNYHFGAVWIRFVGAHAEYDKIDATDI